MEQSILTKEQHLVLKSISGNADFNTFYLSGGTALAEYYLHHRLSEDLDFFCRERFDPLFLHGWGEEMRAVLGCEHVVFNRIADRYQFLFNQGGGKELKVEFVHYAFDNLEELIEHDGISVNALRDIAANKMMALLDRFEPKDFVDLYFLLQQTTLDRIKADLNQKFGAPTDPIFLGTEFLKVRRIVALPRMIKPLTIEELKTFFVELARGLGKEIFLSE